MREIIRKSMKWDAHNDMKSYRDRLDSDAQAFLDTFINNEVFRRFDNVKEDDIDVIDAKHRAIKRDIYSPAVEKKDKHLYMNVGMRSEFSIAMLNRFADSAPSPELLAMRNDIKKIIKSAKNKSDEKGPLHSEAK